MNIGTLSSAGVYGLRNKLTIMINRAIIMLIDGDRILIFFVLLFAI